MRKSSASDSPDNRRIVNEHASDCPDENENGSPDNKAKGSRRKLESSTSTDSHAVSGPSRRNIDLDAGDSSKRGDGANRCIICLKCLYPSKARPSTCSSHYFHATCLKKWSKTSNTCPFCRVEYKNIFIENKNGVLIKRHTVVTPPPQNDNAEQDVPADDFSETDENSLYSDEEDCIRCQLCGEEDLEYNMGKCDCVDGYYHPNCAESYFMENCEDYAWFQPTLHCKHCRMKIYWPNDESYYPSDASSSSSNMEDEWDSFRNESYLNDEDSYNSSASSVPDNIYYI